MKKTSMPNPVKSLGYMESYSSSSPRPAKSPSNSNRYNWKKICCWSRRPNTILEIRKKVTFLWVVNNPIAYKFFKDFINYRKKTNWAVVFSCRTFLNILKYRQHQWNLLSIWKTRLLETLTKEKSSGNI